jgi:FkbM family methyltransferase
MNPLAKLPLPVKRILTKCIPNVKLTARLPDGSPLRFRARNHKGFLFTKVDSVSHERAIFDYYRAQVKEGTIVFDVGANIGIHAVQLGHLVGNTGRVIAFEPEPENLKLLYESLKLNGINDRVTVVERAVDAVSGESKFWRDRVSGATGSLTPRENGNTHGHNYGGIPPEITTISTLSIDDYVREQKMIPDLVKVDVEGAEARVLLGGLQTLRTHGPHVILDGFASDSSDLLFDEGYKLLDLETQMPVNRGDPLPFTVLASRSR